MKRGRPQKIIHEIKLQEPIESRDGLRKDVNKSPENYKERKLMQSEDEFDCDPDYGVKLKPK